jgi:hypothetical protein
MSRRVIGYREGRAIWADEGPATPFVKGGWHGELVQGQSGGGNLADSRNGSKKPRYNQPQEKAA